MKPSIAHTAAMLVAAVASVCLAQPRMDRLRLPRTAPPRFYGTVLIRRATASGETKPVPFAHWKHRLRYTCRVCHLELDFSLRTNETPITEEANRSGAYCGACHDGKTAFTVADPANCKRCHTGTIEETDDGWQTLSELPQSRYGNLVDWSRALALGTIKPAGSLSDPPTPLTLDKTLSLEADWNFVPPAIFPHGEHERWLDCSNCHPAIFNIGRKSTAHFTMSSSLRGDFCGVCHLRVAFPMDDCQRCHPTMDHPPEM